MTLIKNIGQLVLYPRGPIGGKSLTNVQFLQDASLLLSDQKIEWLGRSDEVPDHDVAEVIDAHGCCVVPGLVDCHTHTVFAGDRASEFVKQIKGRSYAEISASGGGIRVTVAAVREATEDQLIELALPRLRRMLQNGVTTVEIKSGYGLSVDDELKMLRAVKRLNEIQPVELVGTYLAAHTTPLEYAGRTNEYLDEVLGDEVLARIREEGLAEFIDVFCEKTAFDVIQARRVLEAGAKIGLDARLHADQITQCGASRLAGEFGARSADHLETIDDEGIEAMHGGGTIAVLLPACSFFLNVAQAPARRLIDADLCIALATDFNPGSSMVESLPLTMSIACTQMRMTPAEALIGATANAAAVLSRQDRIGALAPGMQADLLILDVPTIDHWPYHVGRNCVHTVIKNGKVAAENL
jgi:imidazolonepropionase